MRLTKVSAVYGSFVALPLFLVWQWISWLLLLIAGELLVFVQEKGWKRHIYTYSSSPIENLDTDVAVMACSIERFEKGTPLTILSLYESNSRPIRVLTESALRLEHQGYILRGGTEEQLAAIIPSKIAFSSSLSDLVLPQLITPPQTVSPQIEIAIKDWKLELKTSPSNFGLGNLAL